MDDIIVFIYCSIKAASQKQGMISKSLEIAGAITKPLLQFRKYIQETILKALHRSIANL